MARGRKALQVMEEPAGGAGDEPAHLAQETLLEEPAPGARPRGIPSAITYASPDGVPAPEHDLSDPDLPFWLALNRIKGIGPARFRLLLDAFGTAEGAWRGSVAGWQAAGLDSRTASAFEQQRRKIVPEAELERLVRLRIGVVRIVDEGYPRLLREIALPPPLIYVRGRLLPEDDWALGIVGTRRATAYGRQVTERLAGELAAQRITIVSGLARGIDTYAHTAALNAPGRTIAVLGCGPDLVYPPENAKLAARIVESGVIVTEFAPGTQPEAGNFPARNRLISGLSLGVLVTECPDDSGALITCRFAAEQGRDVFAVPGNITSRASAGANRLLQDGAAVVLAANDILEALNLHMAPQQIELAQALPENDAEARVLAQLTTIGEALHADELVRATELPAATVAGTLVMLELKGLVRLIGPMTYVKG
ncbi:MAG TPA: DNA-processing protein DprA [Ktedonobacterales bacterium]|nr:DNA-processing protein DprA [Ktedonobacterales bacterium]